MQVRKFIKLLPLIFGTGATFVTGCSYGVSKDVKIESTMEDTNSDVLGDTIVFEDNTTVKIENEDDIISRYQEYFKSNVTYHNGEYYLNDKDIEDIINNSNTVASYNYHFDGDINNIIKDIENNSNVVDAGLKSAFDDNKELLDNVLNRIFDEIKSDNSNLDSDFHILDDLKILTYKDNAIENFVCTYIEETNTIVINYNEIKTICEFYNMSFEDQVEYFLTQEIGRVRKNTHKDDKEATLNYRSTNDTLLYEGTNGIELFTKNRIPNDLVLNNNYTYDDEIKAQGELLLLGITNQEDGILDTYFNAVNDNDLKKLWEVYNLKDKDDLVHFYNILYSMDAKLRRNGMIFEYYNSSKNIDYDDFVGFEYKLDLYMRSVNNLLEYQKNNDMSIEDNLIIYNIILNSIINDAYKYDDNMEMIYEPIFMSKMNELNNKYLDYICEYYKMDINHVNDLIQYDTRYIMIDMASIMHNDDKYIEEYMGDAKTMLDKYPITKAIMASDYIYQTQFDRANQNVKENTKTL